MTTKKPTTDPALLAELKVPMTQRGHPDLRNHVPARFVTLEEAAQNGWSLFYDGRACRFGHQSARAVSNVDRCTDCERVRSGKAPIYPQARHQNFHKLTAPPKDAAAPVVIQQPAAPELSAADTRFLKAYVDHRDLALAAKAVGCTPSQILSRRTPGSLLDAAMSKHETDLSIPKYQPPPIARAPESYNWTADIENHLIDLWIDGGLLQNALDQLAIRPSEFYKHVERSPTFASKVEQAKPLALQTARHRFLASQDDKMIRVLESMAGDETPSARLTNAQLDARVLRGVTEMFNWNVYRYRVRATGQVFSASEIELCSDTGVVVPAIPEEETAPDESEPAPGEDLR